MADIHVFTTACHSVNGARYLPRMVTVRAKFVKQTIYHGQSKVLMQTTLNNACKNVREDAKRSLIHCKTAIGALLREA